MVTKDLDLLQCIELIAASIAVGGLVGYLVASARQVLGREPHFGDLVLHFSQVTGIGVAAFVVLDRLLH
jgi:hypothetical protein